MIAFINGTVDSFGTDWVILNNHGVGYQMQYAHTDTLKLNEDIRIYTYLHITENDVSLFGFESLQEQDLFLRLISVKGLGPKTAMSMLSKASVSRLITSIEEGDVNTLKSMPGVGNKTASQIILDLKGKLVESETKDSKKYSVEITEAMDALKNLGFKQGEINQAANYISKEQGLKTEDYIKLGLQYLMKKKVVG